jgi:hypothetical protein
MVMTGKTRIFWSGEFFVVHLLAGRLNIPFFYSMLNPNRTLQQIYPVRVSRSFLPGERSATGVNHGRS